MVSYIQDGRHKNQTLSQKYAKILQGLRCVTAFNNDLMCLMPSLAMKECWGEIKGKGTVATFLLTVTNHMAFLHHHVSFESLL